MSSLSVARKPELLLPAGNPEKLKYAIAYGADAVYLGLPMASLRTPTRGEQFTPQNLAQWVHYAQSRGVKAYVTINIFPSNADLKRVAPHLEQLETIRPDAIIFSDPGVYRLARRHAPSVPLHLSTQANTLNLEACGFWQDLGVERVILAREVPLADIAAIHRALPDLELEAFIHGSLCVAYSGRCVISDYLTDNTKNSNKGMCGNSCRWEFEQSGPGQATGDSAAGSCGCAATKEAVAEANIDPETGLKTLVMHEAQRPNEAYTFEEDDKGSYMLNSRDLCLVRRLREMQDSGIVSFKVEGRTKSVYYAATTARVYREAIDACQNQSNASEAQTTRWIRELSAAGNRGFTEGFADGRPNKNAYNYEDSQSHQTTNFLGTVVPNDDGRFLEDGMLRFKARNPLTVGEPIDWFIPGTEVSFPLSALYDDKGFPVPAVQTNQIARIPLPDALKTHSEESLLWSIVRSQERVPLAR